MTSRTFTQKITWVLSLLLVVTFTACNQMDGMEPELSTLTSDQTAARLSLESPMFADARTSGSGIVPKIIPGDNNGGNRTCAEAYNAFGVEFDENDPDLIVGSSPRINYENDAFAGSFPSELQVSTDGRLVSWGITPPAGYQVKYVMAIVKGGNDANVYFYNGDVRGDSGLASPVNNGGQIAGLSNLTFCYVFEKIVTINEECWTGETAWTQGARFVTKGSWAMYSTASALTSGVNIWAGQHHNAGTATLSNGVITITLNPGFRFAEGNSNVKIQHYSSIPASRNPQIGLFATKGNATSNSFSISVPNGTFYAIHLDVERTVACAN